MPLKHGFTQKSVHANIEQLVKDGKSQAQAVAIATDVARRAKEKAERRKKNGK